MVSKSKKNRPPLHVSLDQVAKDAKSVRGLILKQKYLVTLKWVLLKMPHTEKLISGSNTGLECLSF